MRGRRRVNVGGGEMGIIWLGGWVCLWGGVRKQVHMRGPRGSKEEEKCERMQAPADHLFSCGLW